MPFLGELIDEALEYISTFTPSDLKPAPEACGTELIISRPKLSDLPAAMRNMGWEIAPALMEKWFKRKSFVLTEDISDAYNAFPTKIPAEHCDETTVKMEWIRSFSRGREAYENLLNKLNTDKSRGELLEKIEKALKQSRNVLGSTKYSARQLHEYCQIQREDFGNYMSTIDDLYGSIGKASLYLAVVGELSDDGKLFTVSNIGIYLRDIYEFNGFQPLGLWTKSRTLGKVNAAIEIHQEIHKRIYKRIYNTNNIQRIGNRVILLPKKYLGTNINYIDEPFCIVYNSDFRAYREKYNKGGDFYIFSDVMWEKPKEKITISLEESPQK